MKVRKDALIHEEGGTARIVFSQDLPVRVPSDPECKDVLVRKNRPEQKQNKKKVGRRPRHETVKLGSPSTGFCRGQGRILGQRAYW